MIFEMVRILCGYSLNLRSDIVMRDLKTFKTMIAHLMVILNRKQRAQMLGMMLVILIGSFFELLGVSAMLPFIQALLEPKELISKPYIRFFTDLFGITKESLVLLMVGIGIVIIYIVKNLYLALSSYFQVSYSNSIKRNLSCLVLKSYMDRPYSFFVENGSGVILRGVKDDVIGVSDVVSNIFKGSAEGFVVLAVAIYLCVIDPVLAAGVMAVGLVCMVFIVFGVKKMLTRLSYIHREAVAQLGKRVTEINNGIKDIMVFNRRKMFLDDYEKTFVKASKAEIKSDFAGLMPERIIEASCISGIIIMVLVRLGMGVDPIDFVPKLAVFAMGAFRLLPSISRLAGYASLLIYSRQNLEATYDNIVAARIHTSEVQEDVSGDIDNGKLSFKEKLEIRSLDWQYPQGKEKVLKGLDMIINKGEAIGIVGESGSGKSTLADIMLRLYKPQSGGIYMDGIDISSIPETWSRIMAYVPQSVFLMDDTIRANIVFGSDDDNIEKVWEVLDKASLSDFVRGLPKGLDTIVGERGVKFSGGQRQRIAIARALYIEPQIMILDEATSALDNETEEAVMEAIDSLMGSMTLIIIAHRVTTLKNCDKIYEIVCGKAVERNKFEVVL